MSVIIIPRKHLRQPTGRVTINVAADLAEDLEFLSSGSSRHAFVQGVMRPLAVVGARPVVLAGHVGWGFGAYGTSTADQISVAVADFAQQEVTSFALALFNTPANGRLWDGGSIYAQCGSDAGRNTSGALQYVVEPSTVYGALAYTTAAFPAVGARGRHHRGFQVSTSGEAGSGSSLAMSTLMLGNRAAGDRGLNGVIFMQAHWSRLLTPAAVSELHRNPWQLFKADPIRIYSLPSGPIGISWSSLTASNITQTGATLTLGGITR